jgi:aminoglycoside phosphotransferase (APT) family kinase protein
MMDSVLSFIEQNRSLPDLKELPATLSTLMLTPRFKVSRHVIFLVLEKGQVQPRLVAKIPRLPHLRESIGYEADILQTIHGLRAGGFQSIPRVIAYQDHYGYPILLESAINGRLMSPDVVRRDPEKMTQITYDWLLDVQSQPTFSHDGRWYDELVEAALIALRTDLPLNDKEHDLLLQCEQYLSVLKHLRLPYVLEHGDLGHPNLILTGRDSIGVIDWELANLRGLLAGDLFFFLGYVAFSRNHANESGDYISAFKGAFFDGQPWARPYIQSFVKALGIPSDVVPALFLLCWLRYLVRFVERLQVQKSPSMNPEMLDVVRKNRYYALWKYTVEQFGSLALY